MDLFFFRSSLFCCSIMCQPLHPLPSSPKPKSRGRRYNLKPRRSMHCGVVLPGREEE